MNLIMHVSAASPWGRPLGIQGSVNVAKQTVVLRRWETEKFGFIN